MHSTIWKERTGYTNMNHNVKTHSVKDETIRNVKDETSRDCKEEQLPKRISQCMIFPLSSSAVGYSSHADCQQKHDISI